MAAAASFLILQQPDPSLPRQLKSLIKQFLSIDQFVLSPLEYKRALLVMRLALVFIGALIVFLGVDLWNAYWIPVPYNIVGVICGIAVLALNRRGNFLAAKIVLTIVVNAMAIFFTYELDPGLGIYLFSLCINISILAVYGVERIRLAVILILVSTAGFLFALLHPHERLTDQSPDYIQQNFIVSYLVATGCAIVIVYYFQRINFKVETMLLNKEKDIVQKNVELEKVNRELDKFFYSASHDMRAPLTSILGLIHLMEKTEDVQELKQYTNLLRGRAESLEHFIRQISDYASNGRQEIKLESINLRLLLRECLENLRFYPNAEKIKVRLEVPESVEVQSDRLRLQIIFGNLISNSFKYHDFTKPEPFIQIYCEVVGDQLHIHVKDNGSGIREENLRNIFGMFFRAHRQSQGSGLGLYLVKDALERISGTIDVMSQYGQGTEFLVTLPR